MIYIIGGYLEVKSDTASCERVTRNGWGYRNCRVFREKELAKMAKKNVCNFKNC